MDTDSLGDVYFYSVELFFPFSTWFPVAYEDVFHFECVYVYCGWRTMLDFA